uniref:At1g61320/AtMIF1 LRR domain-containing protein n=1 Tax=Leersia perrieri TaxID=77586 RepID=A0A0D9WBS6_9ORYZ
MEDGIRFVYKRRLALRPHAKVVDNTKQISSQSVDFQSLPEGLNAHVLYQNIVSRIMSLLTLKQAVQMSMLRKEHAHDIDGWVSFAIASKARAVILDFSPYIGLYENNYSFPCHLFNDRNGSHLKVLRLDTVTLGPTPDFCGFASLKILTLEHVLVLDNFQHFLPKCPALEWLKIRICPQLHNLIVSAPLTRLKYLCVQHCAISKIELHAPNLTTFRYSGGFKVIITLHESLKLKTATIGSPFENNLGYLFTGIPNGLPHVQRLHINVIAIATQIPGFTQPPLKFNNLRHLSMTIAFGADERSGKNAVLQLAYLLEAAPFLMDCVDLTDDPPATDVITDRPHYNLKTACITGFNGNGGQVALVGFILRNAVKLEKMAIDPKGRIIKNEIIGESKGRRIIKSKIVPKDNNGVLVIL